MVTFTPSVTSSVRFESQTGGLLDLVDGIPVHPLVVHLAVVIVPVAALGLILMAASRRFSRRFGWLVALVALVAAGSTFLAKEAGEVLRERVGEPGFSHAGLGAWMPAFSVGLAVATVALWLVDRTGPVDQPSRRGLRSAAIVVAILVAAANLLWIFRVGHSGAKSVWSGVVAADQPTTEPSPSASPSGTVPPAESATSAPTAAAAATATVTASVISYTIGQVATHNTAADCWVAVDGKVYDVTEWQQLHPGGAQRITNLCGTDGTAAFRDQHGSASRPNENLAKYLIGTLS